MHVVEQVDHASIQETEQLEHVEPASGQQFMEILEEQIEQVGEQTVEQVLDKADLVVVGQHSEQQQGT